ncbi:hypothetical protein JHK85_003810 [Glycine max]|nr:hypothetical protein JHK85_003810 [Glycine max]
MYEAEELEDSPMINDTNTALAATTHINLDVAYDAFSTARGNCSSKRCRSASTTARPTIIMYKERGGVRSKSKVTSADRKRINDILNKQLERSSSSTSRAAAAINGKDSSSSSLLAAAKDSRFAFVTASISKNSNAFDGSRFLLFSYDLIFFQCQSR